MRAPGQVNLLFTVERLKAFQEMIGWHEHNEARTLANRSSVEPKCGQPAPEATKGRTEVAC